MATTIVDDLFTGTASVDARAPSIGPTPTVTGSALTCASGEAHSADYNSPSLVRYAVTAGTANVTVTFEFYLQGTDSSSYGDIILREQTDGAQYLLRTGGNGGVNWYHRSASLVDTPIDSWSPGSLSSGWVRWTVALVGNVATASLWWASVRGDLGSGPTLQVNAVAKTDGSSRITAAGQQNFRVQKCIPGRFTVSDETVGDTTPPTLSSPTGTGGTLSATGTVSVNETGTLWSKCSATSTESVPSAGAESGAGWTSQTISSTGTQSVNFGTQVAGSRYAHYFAVDGAGNRSTRATAGPFTVTSGSDTTPPVLSSATGTGGTLTATGTVSVNEVGTLWAKCDANATATDPGAGSETADGWTSQTVTGTGTQSVNFGSQTAGTRYAHYLAIDAAGNRSSVANSLGFTVSGSSSGSYTAQFGPGYFATGSGPQLAKSARWYVWAGVSDTVMGSNLPITGSSLCDSNGRWTATGIAAAGAVIVLAFDEDGGVYFERVTAG